jgi:hypothetical protein
VKAGDIHRIILQLSMTITVSHRELYIREESFKGRWTSIDDEHFVWPPTAVLKLHSRVQPSNRQTLEQKLEYVGTERSYL